MNFSLITKLGRKHKKCSVAIINHPQDTPTPSFDSTAWSYGHAAPHTCTIAKHTLTTNQFDPDSTDNVTSTTTHNITPTNDEPEFHGHRPLQQNNFFGIHHTLTGDIFKAPLKYLASAYARLKETKRHRYSIIPLQMLLRSLVISVCGYNPLCSQIPTAKYLQFDRALHAKYIRDTKHTVMQPAHVTFLSRDNHGLHIPSLLMTHLQGRAREFDVCLNSPDPAQNGPPLARLAAMVSTPSQDRSLIRDVIVSLAQYGLHYRDADEPIITNILQLLLHERPEKSLLGQLHTTKCYDSNILFTITGNLLEHTPYSHHHELHQWLRIASRHPFTEIGQNDMQPPPLLYEL